jgi:ribonuclease P protein component
MKPQSLPKACLLRKKGEFDAVYRHGIRVHGANFSLMISIHGQLKGAAKRNRIKRIIREFFRLNKNFLQEHGSGSGKLPCMDIVVTVRQGFSLKSPQEVAEAVGRLLKTKTPLLPQRA